MTQTQSNIGEAVQQNVMLQQGQGLDWLLRLFYVDQEQQRTSDHLNEYPSQVERLQRALEDAGYSARIAEVINKYGHPITHQSGAVRKTHLVVIAGDQILDPYCTAVMPRSSYLQKVYHESHPATLID